MGGSKDIKDQHNCNHNLIHLWIHSDQVQLPSHFGYYQGTHFINEAIEILTTHFLFLHTSSTTYYLHGNGQAKSTNKVIGLLLTKLVNENHMDWDEHLHIVLFTYRTTFKVGTSHIPFQLLYGLHALMLIKYLLPMTNFAMS